MPRIGFATRCPLHIYICTASIHPHIRISALKISSLVCYTAGTKTRKFKAECSMDIKSVSMSQFTHGINKGLDAPFVVMGTTLIGIWLFHLLLNKIYRRRWQYKAVLPPGSMGLPLLGETFEFFTRSPSLDLLPFFKRRMER